MLRVEVERGDRAGRGDEDEAFQLHHRSGARLDDVFELTEDRVEEIAVGRDLFDPFEHDPRSRLTDLADRFADTE